jgi:hypothetical protein
MFARFSTIAYMQVKCGAAYHQLLISRYVITISIRIGELTTLRK